MRPARGGGILAVLLIATSGAAPARAEVSGARGLALGGAWVAAPDDALGVFWNPAALAGLESGGFGLAHRSLDVLWTQESAVLAVRPPNAPRLRLGVAAHVQRRSGTASDESLGGFEGTPGEHAYRAMLQIGARTGSAWQLGAGLGRLSGRVGTGGRVRGWCASGGLAWTAGATRLGLALDEVAFGLRDDVAARPLLWHAQLGLWQGLRDERVGVGLQLGRGRGEDGAAAAGAEWWVVPNVGLRSGFERGFDAAAPATWSAGLGLRHQRLRLDYAWRGAADVRSEHVASLQLAFGDVGSPPSATPARPAAAQVESRRPVALEPPAPAVSPPAAPPTTPRRGGGAAAPAIIRPVPPPGASAPAREDAAPHPPVVPVPPPSTAPSPPAGPETPTGRFVVRAGVHDDLDAAAQEIARLYRAELRPTLERRGALFVVVVHRCATRAEAQEWQRRAGRTGVRCSIDEE